MDSCNVIADVKYRTTASVSGAVKKWAHYAVDPKKCDPTSLDEQDQLKDLIYYSDNELYLDEKKESLAWDSKGDIDPAKDIKDQDSLKRKGTIWNVMISVPNEFALGNGLVTKKDFYDLTNNVMPSFLIHVGFKLNNTLWYATLHRDSKSPNMHIVFFEKLKQYPDEKIPYSSISKLKSLIVNYIIDNKDFYINRDIEFKNIMGNITYGEFTKIKSPKMFSGLYRRELNKKLFGLYEKLPAIGRLQYNSKNMREFKPDIDAVIEYILSHDSIKYKFEEYRIMLMEKQKEINAMYGATKKNVANKYFNDQVKKIYSKIGNDILNNFKIYQSSEPMQREINFLKKHIIDLNFKSRNDYLKQERRIDIARDLYKICLIAELNDNQTKKVIDRWILNSKYNLNSDALISSFKGISYDMSSTDLYNFLKKLGYDYAKYKKLKDKNFYKEINYKIFFNRAINHVMYELVQEDKNIVDEIRYDLAGY